jgi:hypothetical protein
MRGPQLDRYTRMTPVEVDAARQGVQDAAGQIQTMRGVLRDVTGAARAAAGGKQPAAPKPMSGRDVAAYYGLLSESHGKEAADAWLDQQLGNTQQQGQQGPTAQPAAPTGGRVPFNFQSTPPGMEDLASQGGRPTTMQGSAPDVEDVAQAGGRPYTAAGAPPSADEVFTANDGRPVTVRSTRVPILPAPGFNAAAYNSAVAPAVGQGTPDATVSALPRVSSPADARRLPRGSRFIDPAGQIRTVP